MVAVSWQLFSYLHTIVYYSPAMEFADLSKGQATSVLFMARVTDHNK